MPYQITESVLNASTLDILNVIRQNSSAAYQAAIPAIETEQQIVHVGQVLLGHPALANEFAHALVNEIALKRMQSVIFNNPLKRYKKGFLEFGETVEEIFVEIAKGRHYSPEKGAAREMRRYIPDIKTAFHVINWRVLYPVSIQRKDIERAFRTVEGVRSLIENIIQSVYTAAEYDEYLLFKYLLIKGVANGAITTVNLGAGATLHDEAIAYRGAVNKLPFISNKFNARGVNTATPKDRLCIFMSADHEAAFDVDVLAAAFNLDKADFLARKEIIDDFTTFDNDRFDIIRAESDGLEEVTDAELAKMATVTAMLIDSEWFQVYDNVYLMNDDEIAAGLYWNYFLHVWKTVSFSPFSNAITFMKGATAVTAPASFSATVATLSSNGDHKVKTISPTGIAAGAIVNNFELETSDGSDLIGVTDYGAALIQLDDDDSEPTITAVWNYGEDAVKYTFTGALADGTITFNKVV